MLREFIARVCYVITGCVLFGATAKGQISDHYWFHDPPYVDPFFYPNGAAKTNYADGYTTRPRHPGHAAHHSGVIAQGGQGIHCGHGLLRQNHCAHCGVEHSSHCMNCGTDPGGEGSACASCLSGINGTQIMGRRGPICPDITTARLQVYVPDGYQVEINGQRTKPQTLGGIHKNSRIFTLEGLSFESASATDIVIVECDLAGNMKRHTHFFYAQAGNSYKVRYPAEFTLTAYVTPDGRPVRGVSPINQGQLMPQSVFDGSRTRSIQEGSVAPQSQPSNKESIPQAGRDVSGIQPVETIPPGRRQPIE